MTYILMRKVVSSKKMINISTNITDMALYSKTFKRFIGILPKEYKESIS